MTSYPMTPTEHLEKYARLLATAVTKHGFDSKQYRAIRAEYEQTKEGRK